MFEKIRLVLSLIAAPFTRLGYKIGEFILKIFPRKAAKYFDADLHELKYICLMFVYAFFINLYIETFARLTTSPIEGFLWMCRNPLVFLYSVILIFATMTIALLFKKRRFAWMIISIIWVVIGSVNGIILLSRVTPFTLYDLANFTEGLSLVTTYYAVWQIFLIILGGALIALTIVLIFIRSAKWQNIKYGKSIAAIVIAGLFALGSTWVAINFNIVGTYFGNLNYAFRDYGYAYGFISTSVSAGISKPKGYSDEMIQEILEEKTTSGTDTVLEEKNDSTEHPNIIVLQMESFTTAQSYSHFTVNNDPTPVYNSLKENYTSGWFEVPACGAGTANTEFEVLTGISAKYFGPGEYPYKGKLRENTLENMAYVAKSHGYVTSAMHDHRALFYNRNEVYANMGFDSFTSVEYMNNVKFTPTNWCKDEILTGNIIDIMTSTKERDMMHVVSVEGHGRYPTEQVFKNPYVTVTMKDSYDVDEEIKNELKWKYEYYLNECHEMDTFIGNLIDAINATGEPTIMLIYGDHIPALDVTDDIYNGPDLYQTEYVIWDNIGLEKKDKDIAAYQVGAEILEDAGLAHEGVIFDYQQTTSSKDKNYDDDMEALAYDILYGKYYAFKGTNPYKPAKMTMGFHQIEIDDIIKIGDKYYIQGSNFTERSIISLDGKQLSTVYLSPTLLALNEDVDEEDISRLEVSQVDKTEEQILTTVGANEEL
ncbi:MAG: sulfatase-like hydrolase/transferase [Clostridiales bacterium]|nr:sulfatase-like hydrolase/transferase [Candidatus Crickella caballi]